jgi:hypothetical protein
VALKENPPNYLPVNQKFMFYNSVEETIIYSDVFIEKTENKHCAILNYRIKATMMHDFDLMDFPFDRQYLGIKLNSREQFFNYVLDTEHVLAVIPSSPKLSFVQSPFTSRVSFSLSAFKLVAVFADLAPADLAPGAQADKPGKPLYYSVVERNSLYHYHVFVVPMSFTMASSLIILITDPVDDQNFGNRTNLIVTLFLALISLKYVLANSLPEGQQETILDESIKNMFLLMFIITLETGMVHFYDVDPISIPLHDGNALELRVFDTILFFVVLIFVLLTQLQFCVAKARLSFMCSRMFCWCFTGSDDSEAPDVDEGVLSRCCNCLGSVDYCSCCRPQRPIVKPWVCVFIVCSNCVVLILNF